MNPLPPLDRTDFAILALLQKNARLGNKEIAAAVGLAPSSTHERLRRLWEAGVLRGLHADVDPHALGIGLEALLMIELAKHDRSNVDQFMSDVIGVPEVRSAFLITGRWDVIVHVGVRDTQHLKDLALDHFTNRPGVLRIETAIVYDARHQAERPCLVAPARPADDEARDRAIAQSAVRRSHNSGKRRSSRSRRR